MFWICDGNSFNTGNVFVIAEKCLPSVKDFPAPLPCQQVGWRCTKICEGTLLGQLTLTDQRDSPYHTTLCSALKMRGWMLVGAANA